MGKALLKEQVVQWLLEDKPQTQSVEDHDNDAGSVLHPHICIL